VGLRVGLGLMAKGNVSAVNSHIDAGKASGFLSVGHTSLEGATS
jgi:hypothetical protein